jgi:uncharacterized protein YjiS (DUF1127 family)
MDAFTNIRFRYTQPPLISSLEISFRRYITHTRLAMSQQIALPHGLRRARRPLYLRLLDLVELRRQRRALAALDDLRLRDIGLTREEAKAEARRPIWDAPRTGASETRAPPETVRFPSGKP